MSAPVGRFLLARRNTQLDSGYAKTVQTWEEPDRQFGSAGVALGLRGDDDKEKKK